MGATTPYPHPEDRAHVPWHSTVIGFAPFSAKSTCTIFARKMSVPPAPGGTRIPVVVPTTKSPELPRGIPVGESEGAVFDGLSPSGRKDLFRWLLAGLPAVPRIESLEISGVAAEDVHYPSHLLPGRPVRVSGRTASATELEVTVRDRMTRRSASRSVLFTVAQP